MPLRLIIFSLTAILAIFSSSAQAHYNSKFAIGGKAGISLSSVAFTPSVKESMAMGQLYGVTFRYWEERHFGLIGELNFVQRGWKENFEEHPFDYTRTLNYIELPIMTNIFFGGKKVNFFVNLGPQIGYLLSSSSKANFDVANIASIPDFPSLRETGQLTEEASHRIDYGITAGVGVEYIIARRHRITLEGRYYFGIGNIFPDERRDTFSASRNSSILITLGYSFRLK